MTTTFANGNPDHLFGLSSDWPTISEQRSIRAHNEPIIELLSEACRVACVEHGYDSEQYRTAAVAFDAAWAKAANFDRI